MLDNTKDQPRKSTYSEVLPNLIQIPHIIEKTWIIHRNLLVNKDKTALVQQMG
jgi:hypothetical protein